MRTIKVTNPQARIALISPVCLRNRYGSADAKPAWVWLDGKDKKVLRSWKRGDTSDARVLETISLPMF